MRYVLPAVILVFAAFGIAPTAAHAQLAFGPDGFRFGEPMDRHHRHHMRRDWDHEWNHEHHRHWHHHYVPDEDDEE